MIFRHINDKEILQDLLAAPETSCRFVILWVKLNNVITSVWCNNTGGTSWRSLSNNWTRMAPLTFTSFDLTDDSLLLDYGAVNVLANNFKFIAKTFEKPLSIGIIPVDDINNAMERLVKDLHNSKAEIQKVFIYTNAISGNNELVLNLRNYYHSLRGNQPNINIIDFIGNNLLNEFEESVKIFAEFPLPIGFGTDNEGRSSECPVERAGRFRYFLQHNCDLDCSFGNIRIKFIDYEVKPLNINTLSWNCNNDLRLESIDILLSFGGIPILSEVKMREDKLPSFALVQILYYGSILANKRQSERIANVFKLNNEKAIACIISEVQGNQDLNGNNDQARTTFFNDLRIVKDFLENDQVKELLSKYFQGFIILLIEPDNPKMNSKNELVQAWKVANDGFFFDNYKNLKNFQPAFID